MRERFQEELFKAKRQPILAQVLYQGRNVDVTYSAKSFNCIGWHNVKEVTVVFSTGENLCLGKE